MARLRQQNGMPNSCPTGEQVFRFGVLVMCRKVLKCVTGEDDDRLGIGIHKRIGSADLSRNDQSISALARKIGHITDFQAVFATLTRNVIRKCVTTKQSGYKSWTGYDGNR